MADERCTCRVSTSRLSKRRRYLRGTALIKALGVCCALSALFCGAAPVEAASDMPGLKLERVVILMRHGIRPPTNAQPIPKEFSPLAWPTWTVEPGMLTDHGAKGIALLGKSDRAYLIEAALLPKTGCPAGGTVSVHASDKPRAIQTAEAWVESALPGCPVLVDHPAEGEPDPLFHGLEHGPGGFDGHRAASEALALAPAGGLAAEDRALAPEFGRLEAILGCAKPKCDLESAPTRLLAQPNDRPDVDGAIDVASTASQSLLLEYLEGMPMKDVGWGRATREDIERLLRFHPMKFKYGNRPHYVAKAAAGALARTILEAFSPASTARITVLAGHDTNLADLGGLLDLHWHAATYPADDVPPGGALGFELMTDSHGAEFVRAFFRSQTMDQLRNLEELEGSNPAFREYVEIPRCRAARPLEGCPLSTFKMIVESSLRE